MAYYGKAAASRIIAGQPLSCAGTGTSFSTKFSGETFQVRVISQINGWVAVLDTTAQMFSTSTLMSTVGSIGATFIAANTANGDYFACNPGQILGFTSTTTGTTGTIISLAEMS